MELSNKQLLDTLQSSRLSITKPREAIFNELAKGPITVSALANNLKNSIDRATVYRTAELFERLGIINRSWHGFEHKIELSEIFVPHHHHAVCQNCSATIKIASPELESILNKIAKNNNFITVNHSVELIGYCQKCH